MPIPTWDIETYSEAGFVWNEPNERKPLGHWSALPGASKKGLSAVGSAVYFEHPSTEILTASYDLCDGHGMRRWRPNQPLPIDLFDHVAAGRPLESHNAMFERGGWNTLAVRKYGWPPLVPHVQRCSMATAHVDQFPGALGNLGDVLRLDIRKDKEGERLLKKFSMPRDPTKADPRTRIRPEDDPEDFERLCAYCDQDVRAEMAAADRMEPMTPAELGFWLIDQEVNSRGLAIDRDGVRDCIAVLGQVLEQYGAECRALTGGIGPAQVEALRGWLSGAGVSLPSLDAETVAVALTQADTYRPDARRVLELRALTGSASVKKLYAIENQCSADNRLRNLIVHHGARTGRPTGEGPQPLNLPKAGPKLVECECGRPHRLDVPLCPWCGALGTPGRRGSWRTEYVDHVLEIMAFRSLAMIERFFGDAMLAISGCLRGLFVAGDGNDLIASDYSSIEAVVAAELAGETWRIEAFERNDPIYLVGASKITGKPLQFYLDYFEEHGEHHPDRQKIGKVSELACLGADTLVWTRRPNRFVQRWKRIVDVAPDDLVYDGVRFVPHGGLVKRGVRAVECRAGIVATPDHQFLVGRTWHAFDQMTDARWRKASDILGRLFVGAAPECAPSLSAEQKVYDLADCGPRNRFVVASSYGPVIAHNCGFSGWLNSYKAFGSTEPDDVIKAQILAWRAASPAIVEMWGGQYRGLPWESSRRAELYGLEGMAVAAIQNPGVEYSYRSIRLQVVQGVPGATYWEDGDKWLDANDQVCNGPTDRLLITLPSGRQLTYHEPKLTPGGGWAKDEQRISYMTWNSNPKYGPMGWTRMDTYGGRIFENVVQAVAHDILRHALILLRFHHYPSVLSVYDEIVVEVPKGFGSIDELENIMGQMPDWAKDWPIHANGGWKGVRYRKA